GHCCYTRESRAFLTAAFEIATLTAAWLAKLRPMWPILADPIFSQGGKMTRALALLVAALAFLAGSGPSRAQGVDMRDIMGGGPNFFSRGGASPIPRETVYYPANYAPGTILIDTAERRLYLILGNGQALRYGIGVGRDGFRWSGVHRVSAKKEWPDWTPPAETLARACWLRQRQGNERSLHFATDRRCRVGRGRARKRRGAIGRIGRDPCDHLASAH